MKLPRLCLALVIGCLAALTASAAADSRVYELRTYTAAPGKLPDLQARFRDHTLKLFEKHGMKNVGYWVPAEVKDGKEDKLIYLLEHKSREAAAASWKAFVADAAWKEVAKKTEANGKIVAKLESIYLKPTDYSKAMDAGNGKGAARVFEMRTYTAPEGKLGALDARFRDHTVGLFNKHGMTNLGYFHPMDADKGAGTTLIYFMAYPSREAAAASWKKFREDPEWTKVAAASQKDGKLTAKSPDSVYLTPADYSAIK